MKSQAATLCSEIAAWLNGQAWDIDAPVTFNAGYANITRIRREAMDGSAVGYVSPASLTQRAVTRADWDNIHEISLGIMQAVSGDSLDVEDQFLYLFEQIPLAIVNVAFSGARLVSINDEGSRANFVQDEVDKQNVFVAATSLYYLKDGRG